MLLAYENKMKVTRAGGVDVAITAMKNCKDNSDVVLSALKLLGNLLELGNILGYLERGQRSPREVYHATQSRDKQP